VAGRPACYTMKKKMNDNQQFKELAKSFHLVSIEGELEVKTSCSSAFIAYLSPLRPALLTSFFSFLFFFEGKYLFTHIFIRED
jgi:hypothetical protein